MLEIPKTGLCKYYELINMYALACFPETASGQCVMTLHSLLTVKVCNKQH